LPRHSSICFHHAASALASGTPAEASSMLLQFVEHVRQVADDGHIDLDALRNRGGIDVDVMILRGTSAKCDGLPITRSSKRAPTAIRTSQFCIAMLAS
jgi:hypothetical protein